MDGYIDKSPAIAKVYIIAKEETVRVVADVEFALSDSILRLTVRRVPLVIQRQELTLLDTQIADFGKERDRWLEEMKLHTLSGSVDQQRWKTIEGNFQFESQRVSETLAKRGNVASDLYAKQLEFARECMHESLQLSGLILPAITAMRKELGIPTDDKAFTEIFRTSIEKQKENLADFLGAAKDFDKPSPMEGPISRTTASMTP